MGARLRQCSLFRVFVVVMVSFGLIWDAMGDRQVFTRHAVILSTKTAEIRHGVNEEAEESQAADAAADPSPGYQLTPGPPEGYPNLPEETSSPPK